MKTRPGLHLSHRLAALCRIFGLQLRRLREIALLEMRFAGIAREARIVRRALAGTSYFFACIPLLVIINVGLAAASSDGLPGHALGDRAVRAHLSVAGALAAGHSTEATVELTPAAGWHIYGPEHGDAGAPPTIVWQLPHGVRAGAIRYPPSRRVHTHGLTTYEYRGRTELRVPFTAAKALTASGRVPIRADVTWYACSKVCVPGGTTLSATLDITPPASDGFIAAVPFIALAFLGGLVLNLMPCVFPVLSFKALRAIGEPYDGRLRSAIAYAAGVTSSCVTLGIALLAFRAAGYAIGWGFQLQSPLFVAFLAALMLALALAMSGVFEVTLPIPIALQRRAATAGAFGDGILVTLIASACIAPYMGAALAFALAASVPVALGVFIALGLGIALPHTALMITPALLRWVPKPGPWLLTARRVLAIPLYLSAAWLGWVLTQQVVVPSRNVLARAAAGPTTFSTARLSTLRHAHKAVLVDVGAAWCITCKVNERFALDRLEVTRRLAALHVMVLRGDWTNQDPQISAYLHSLDAAGVPLYVYYSPSGGVDVWPQLLTPKIVVDRLNRA